MYQVISSESNWRGQYVIVRSSCNVPLTPTGEVANLYRLKQSLPTIKYLSDQGARVIIVGHIGREATDTLRPVFQALAQFIPLKWAGTLGSDECSKTRMLLQDGEVMILENIRQDERESNNDRSLAVELAALADAYVNDAFDNIHRDHATMVALPELLPTFAGLNLHEELSHLVKVMTPEHPALFILGGAKFETKLPLIEKYLATYDYVFVGGALANDILLAKGYEVGTSLVSELSLRQASFLDDPKLIMPVDLVVESERGIRVAGLADVAKDEKIIDMGPGTIAKLSPYVAQAKTILWNGPLGLYEKGAAGSTQAVANLIARTSAYSVLGGGDTVAAVEELGLNDKFGFVSTGGGAMLTLLEKGNTPALAALGYQG